MDIIIDHHFPPKKNPEKGEFWIIEENQTVKIINPEQHIRPA